MDAQGTHVEAGRVLEWIDRAGYACAVGWSAGYCVTAYVGNVHYDAQIRRGDIVEIDAHVVHTGKSSIHVLVSVHARALDEVATTRAMHCILVFVTVDESGRPVPTQPWLPQTHEDIVRQKLITERIPVRTQIREAMLAEQYTDAGTTPRSVLRFVAGTSSANWAGNAHGGTVMRWINEAAATCALQISPGGVRARYSGGIHFHHPIRIGSLVEVDARAILVEKNDIHVSVLVRSAHPSEPGRMTLTTRCMLIYNSEPQVGLAELILRSDEDRRLAQHARSLAAMRMELTKLCEAV